LHINHGRDKKKDPAALSEIFTIDAVWESTAMSIRKEGLEDIIDSFIDETLTVLFATHCYSNPIIKVSENSATGNWLFWVASKFEKDKTNQVYMSQDIIYTRTTDGWRIKYLSLHFGDVVKNISQ
jgi:hypothetical protein